MNSFGRIFRVSVFGESHGNSVGLIIDGCPPGISLTVQDFFEDIERRKPGAKGTTSRKEDDIPEIISGVYNDKTTGTPITILFKNINTRSEDYKQRAVPRPGHADFVALKKFKGFEDYRGGGHFSGRLTVVLVAAGVVAKKILDLTPNPSPKERGTQPGYITNTIQEWKLLSDFAKENRKNSTEAEDKLWQEIRNRKINGYKFRRQHAIAGYIPDFICLEKKLVVEIDGEYHNTEEQQKFDTLRTDWLNEHKYHLIRFSNDEVLNNISTVLEKLTDALLVDDAPGISIQEVSKALSFGEGLGEVPKKVSIQIKSAILELGGEINPEEGLQKAIDAKDSIGGIIECRVSNLPIGLGEPFFDSAESVISHAVFSIPAVRGIEFGTGFAAAKMFGSVHNDAIENTTGKTITNHSGGIVGGLTNGNELVFRVAIKPTSSTPKEQQTLNTETGNIEPFFVKGRHDLCIALRVPVVLEAVTAIVLADLLLLNKKINSDDF